MKFLMTCIAWVTNLTRNRPTTRLTNRSLAWTFVLATVWSLSFWSVKAFACGGGTCFPVTCAVYGRDSLNTDESCGEVEVPHLDPQNWTEENLKILANELTQPESDEAPSGEGSIDYCDSNTEAAAASFRNVTSDIEPNSDKLAALREAFGKSCLDAGKAKELLDGLELIPKDEKNWEPRTYLRALIAFYSQDWPTAISSFRELSKSKRALFAERGLYLTARSLLLAPQAKWDGYSWKSKEIESGKASFKEAAEIFAKIASQPSHEWSKSAKGLQRKALLLAGDLDGFTRLWNIEVEAVLRSESRSRSALLNLFSEAWRAELDVLPTTANPHPLLALIRAYYATRVYPAIPPPENQDPDLIQVEHWKKFSVPAELAKLEASRDQFKSHPDIFAWTKAVYLLALGKSEEGYKLLQEQPVAKLNGTSLSWVILNARLQMGMGKYDDARADLVKFVNRIEADRPSRFSEFEANAQTHSARHFYVMIYLWQKKLKDIFLQTANEKMILAQFAESLLRNSVPTHELRELVTGSDLHPRFRKAVESTALTKSLLVRDYAEFSALWLVVKNEDVRKTFMRAAEGVKALESNPKDPAGLALVAMRLADADSAGSLGGEFDLRDFATCKDQLLQINVLTSPYTLLKESLGGFAKGKPNPVEAEALATMLKCFKDTTLAPYCFLTESRWKLKDEISRTPWFKRLHKLYPKSKSAKELKVYW